MIRRSELLEVEKIGRSRIVAAVTSDTAVLTQASNMLCFTIQGAVLIFFVGLYVAYLSIAAFILTFVIVVGAGTIFHHKNKRLAAQKGKSAAWERRLFDRLTDSRRLQGSAAEPRAQRRPLCRRRRRVDDGRQYQDPHPGRNLQDDRDLAGLDVCAARRGGVCRAKSEQLAWRYVDRQGDDGAAVHRRRLFRTGAVDPDPAQCQCGGRPHRASRERPGDRALGGRAARAHRAQALRQDRNAEHRIPLYRPLLRYGVQDRPDRFHLECRRACFHHRRQRIGQIDLSTGVVRPLPAGFRRTSSSTAPASTTIPATIIAR